MFFINVNKLRFTLSCYLHRSNIKYNHIRFNLWNYISRSKFNVDEYKDIIRQSLSDTGRITSKKSFVWKLEIGRTNTTMVTCQTIDTDGQYDTVRFAPTYDNPILSNIETDKINITKYVN